MNHDRKHLLERNLKEFVTTIWRENEATSAPNVATSTPNIATSTPNIATSAANAATNFKQTYSNNPKYRK